MIFSQLAPELKKLGHRWEEIRADRWLFSSGCVVLNEVTALRESLRLQLRQHMVARTEHHGQGRKLGREHSPTNPLRSAASLLPSTSRPKQDRESAEGGNPPPTIVTRPGEDLPKSLLTLQPPRALGLVRPIAFLTPATGTLSAPLCSCRLWALAQSLAFLLSGRVAA